MSDSIPTAADVIAWLNERLAARGLPYRVETIEVLPYVSPMWLANWSAPELAGVAEQDIIEEEIREARWRFPQVIGDW